MERNAELRTWAFVAMLVGGVLVVAGGLMGALMMGAWGAGGMMGMGTGMGMWQPVGGAWAAAMMAWMALWGLLTGGAILLAAAKVRGGADAGLWGVVAIVAGGLSLLAMGGYVVGAVSAIVGGALALAAGRPAAPARPGA